MKLITRMLTEPNKRLLWKFAYNFGYKGMRAIGRFEKRLRRGEFFPAFLFISVTNACNLSCQGCWVSQTNPPRQIAPDTLDHMIESSKAQGSYFFGILGGEPLMYEGLLDVFKKHPDCYFLLFTNGTLISEEVAVALRLVGNVSPLVSIEGLEEVSDVRRGGIDVFSSTFSGIKRCREQGLVIGAATSICKSNINELLCESFVNQVAEAGILYLWYYIYRPVGPNPSPELALSADEVTAVRRFIVNMRKKAPLMIVDAYWDADGNALCPAAVGMAHHISPDGYVEPCPPLQFAKDHIGDGSNLYDLFNQSTFLADFRAFSRETSRGCILMEHPDKLDEFMVKHGAIDTSGREAFRAELKQMCQSCSHHQPGQEIPESSWSYRFAKKYWFFGFGAYG